MARQGGRPIEWTGRVLFDANGKEIGTIGGLAFPRRKFGTKWLLVETVSSARIPVPLIGIRSSGDRLVLPYPRSYVESGPRFLDDQPLSEAEQRRLSLHYGFDDQIPGSTCCQTCGLCHAARKTRSAG